MRIFYTSLLCLLSFSMEWNLSSCKRGPHHPKSEIDVGRKTLDEHLAHEAEHIEEDMKNQSIEGKSIDEMNEEEKNFYYFKLHDSDNNNALDGLELLLAATHHTTRLSAGSTTSTTTTSRTKTGVQSNEDKDDEINHIIDVIDDFIDLADVNKDGYLNYPEYATAMLRLTTSDSYT